MRSYNWWQDRLSERFFGPDQAGRPLLFFVDDDEAARLHRDASATGSIDDLCIAVAQEAIDWHNRAYRWVDRETSLWRRCSREDPPPCLPLLAVCVLAATHMRGDGNRGAPAYYSRLGELLPAPRHVRHVQSEEHLKRDYGTVKELWGCLHEWLEEQDGSRGVSTLHAYKGRERIGYAQSQALICAADHDRLAPFFRECREREAGTILRRLRQWRGRNGLSPGLREALSSNARDNLLGPLLLALADSTKHASYVPRGLRRLPLQINATDDPRIGWTLKWRAIRVPGVTEDKLIHHGGHVTLTTRDEGSLYVLSGDLPDLRRGLQEGVTAQGEYLSIASPPRRHPIVLQEDPLGGWTEVAAPTPHTPSLLLFNRASEKEAQDLVHQAGFEWEEPEESTLDGWFVAADIEFVDRGKTPRSRLAGGLRLRPNNERRHYLVGGEPDLIPPPDVAVVRLDNKPIATWGKRTELRGRGLTVGEHVIHDGTNPLTFYLHDPQRPAPSESGDVLATVPVSVPSAPAPVEGSRVIDAEGNFTDLGTTARLGWWSERGTGLRTVAGVEIPQSAVWLVVDHPDGSVEVRLLRKEKPRITRMTLTMRERWIPMFTIDHPPAERRLWINYLQEVFLKGRSCA
ncbi:hypothetical protein [Nonomuraea harbinensis]|uniref:DUF3893 domain-containing protein n=1 Tax=Nonomuraea harbinensis TaxID=1286938 RepID=A0ABW1C868_9ACTN|nr:hypothetical protein [Nonomuraea harbinensis]